ncbi:MULTISPECIES: M23 family metallopeptidase [Aurantimicrobium]|uniref:Murein DD-endopeptidase MepM n=2 Tax=Aurantimicrobium TaxID=1705353 RepID=A0A2Z3RW04_9MICO|nr:MULTISPECIES: M23 family metallopeptidase [Aurantimicrobium]AWR20740.1 Murein DD-endopeptidase MepM [Aurantimicrobium photophilum]MDF9809812.1 murein DD-endopeptidase MepM/ murein hydrolase activator NlpD [Aurantimicrobium minutum]MDH6254714.1 murein DD-endopeptidase MepM/ murein hydrolase activator NlpD [Aurantimicrobium minutum]MDH6277751.1 murein DD-endopeptidase MepM/ murein hydrolase activator NlpD [Aurantimicrobium minutum]
MKSTEGTPKASVLLLRNSRTYLAIAVIAIAGLVSGVVVSQSASATDYPSWADVENARGNEAAKTAQIAQIQGLIAQLQAETEAAIAEATKKGEEYGVAMKKFGAAEQTAGQLEAQATKSQAEADAAAAQAGRLAAQLYRSGGSDLSMNLLMEKTSDGADKLLSKLGSMSKLAERSNAIYATAQTAQNEAASLSKQAKVALKARDELRAQAEAAFTAATAAQEAAQAKLTESENQQMIMQAQLAALQDATAATVAGYEAGVAEAARIAAERAAAEAAARGISVSGAGWTHPVPNGYISSSWGPRDNFYIPGVGWTGSFHNATDLAAGCGSPIYAASGGRVTYAGAIGGGYGYMVEINHGGGIRTRYGHVTSGGIEVGYGDTVGPGTLIARVGATGLATGCHVHFEVHDSPAFNGIDPEPFMADRGAPL